jgi:hypothetical protein
LGAAAAAAGLIAAGAPVILVAVVALVGALVLGVTGVLVIRKWRDDRFPPWVGAAGFFALGIVALGIAFVAG